MLALEIVPMPEISDEEKEFFVRDAKDQPILRAALAAKVDVLITGDKDFLEATLAEPKILSPAEFVRGFAVDC